MAKQNRGYDFTIAPGGAFVLPVEGDYYLVTSASNPVNVSMDSGGGSMNILANQGETKSFKRLTLTDASGLGSTGTIVIGDGSFLNLRTSGTITTLAGSVVDIFNQSATGPKANQVFMGKIRLAGATIPIVQLWNPNGSGKSLEVTKVWLEATAAAQLFFSFDTQQRTTLGGNGWSLLGNGAQSTAQLRSVDAGVTTFLTMAASAPDVWVPAAQSVLIPFDEPWVVPPNLGLSVYATAATTFEANFLFRER